MCVKFQYCCFYCVSYESVCECSEVLLHGIDRCRDYRVSVKLSVRAEKSSGKM